MNFQAVSSSIASSFQGLLARFIVWSVPYLKLLFLKMKWLVTQKKKNCRVSLIGARGFCNITFYNNNILGKYLPDCRKTLEAVQDIFKPEKCKQSLGRLKILYIRRYRILKVTLNVYIKTRTLLLQGNSRKEFGRWPLLNPNSPVCMTEKKFKNNYLIKGEFHQHYYY